MARVRNATSEDIEDIMGIVTPCVQVMNEQGNYQWNSGYPIASDFILDITRNELYVIVNEDGELVAVGALCSGEQPEEYAQCGLDLSQPAIVPHRIAVSVKQKGKGYAKKFYELAEELAISKKFYRVRVDTCSLNTAMNGLIESFGYQRIGGEIKLLGKPPDMQFYCYEKVINN